MSYPARRRRLRSINGGRDEEEWAALKSQNAPQIPWNVFLERFDWKQSEFVALIGPNGSGKTNCLISILPERDYIVMLATKPRDRTLEELVHTNGFDVYHDWPTGLSHRQSAKRIIWPDATSLEADETQRRAFLKTLQAVYDEGNWCLVVDEGYYISVELKLAPQLRKYWTQARSLDVSMAVGTQRPSWVPKEMYSESTHIFLWSMVEHDDVQRVSSLGRANVDLVRAIIPTLPPHQFLYVNTRTGALYRSYAPYSIEPEKDDGDDEKSGEVNQQ
jgi:hypothetical protein